ncbi:MAG TPA: hypothetical protein VF644_10235 [Pyrinomonadaceae bacterium]
MHYRLNIWSLLFLLSLVLAYSPQKMYGFELDKYEGRYQVQFVYQESDEDQIRKVVRDSQFYESLTIYTNPNTFDKNLLTQFWVPADKGGVAILKVNASVQRLKKAGWHYGKGSENEVFTIRSVRIRPPGDIAEVRTQERWYLPLVDEEERAVPNRNPIIEFPVTYTLRKIDRRWLIQDSSAIYASN